MSMGRPRASSIPVDAPPPPAKQSTTSSSSLIQYEGSVVLIERPSLATRHPLARLLHHGRELVQLVCACESADDLLSLVAATLRRIVLDGRPGQREGAEGKCPFRAVLLPGSSLPLSGSD